jgi:hypothetical protein
MKPLFWIGLLLVILGIAAFIVPVPRSESHGIRVGDASIGVQTHSSERLPLWVGGVGVVVGAVMMVAGSRKG